MKVVEMWAELRATDGLVFWAAAPAVWAARRTSAHTSDHTQSGKTERNRKKPTTLWPETNNTLTSKRRERLTETPVRCVDPLFPNQLHKVTVKETANVRREFKVFLVLGFSCSQGEFRLN